jgi:hypothetical protein
MKNSFSHSYGSTKTMVYFGTRDDLTIGCKYEILPYRPTYSGSDDYVVLLHNDLDFKITVGMEDFCSIEEWRDKQINKII